MKAWLKAAARRHLSAGLADALQSTISEYATQRRHRAGVRLVHRRYADSQGLRLHLGCGPNYKPGWVNIDLFSPGADIELDLREALPFTTASVVDIYSEHVFEHFSYPAEINRLLAECLRVLAPGGALDIGVPDTEAAIRDLYVRRDPTLIAEARTLYHPPWCDLPLHQLNYHFRQEREHKYAWDEETLSSVLKKAGFVDIRRRDFEDGLDTEFRRGSLYVRCHKP
jgi:predicted SAM-dependent methyltransferase